MNAWPSYSSFRAKLAAMQHEPGFPRAVSLHPGPDAESRPRVNAAASLLGSTRTMLDAVWTRLKVVMEERRAAQRSRRLRVLETVSLGEKRFLAIVQVRDQEFLIGSSASGVSLLTCLDAGQASSVPNPLADPSARRAKGYA